MSEYIALLSSVETYISLGTLTVMEIVLGIDNIIFISIVSSRLPKNEQKKARMLGLMLALLFRVGLLACISWIVGLREPILTLPGLGLSGRDLILLGGGLFLIAKSTSEIHHKIEDPDGKPKAEKRASFGSIVWQIVLLDIVFSFDSVVTAVGLAQHLSIMVAAVVLSMLVMIASAEGISNFVNKHPTIKMLALAFLLMIGTLLVAEGCHFHVPRGYIYFAMAFSVAVEFLNMRVRKNAA